MNCNIKVPFPDGRIEDYELATRFMLANLFEKALPFIWDGKSQMITTTKFICWAIDEVTTYSDEARALAKKVIEDKLQFCSMVSSYVSRQLYGDTNYIFDNEDIQAYRRAWVEDLIKEFRQ